MSRMARLDPEWLVGMTSKYGFWETEYSPNGIPYRLWRKGMPRISDDILDSVVYIYRSEDAARNSERIGGTGFLVGVQSETREQIAHVYIVTNSHVVNSAGPECAIRLNTKGKNSDTKKLGSSGWGPSPDDSDVSLFPMGLSSDFHQFRYIDMSAFLTKEEVGKHNVGPGDDIFMVGRFVKHAGDRKNLPMVRLGYIGMMPNEPIEHPHWKTPQESYLADMRSGGGCSGSAWLIHF